jgi:hypothetical protein
MTDVILALIMCSSDLSGEGRVVLAEVVEHGVRRHRLACDRGGRPQSGPS